jgi:hypothetical protein
LAQTAGKIFKGHIGHHNRLIALSAGSFFARNYVVEFLWEDFLTFCTFETNLEFHKRPPTVAQLGSANPTSRDTPWQAEKRQKIRPDKSGLICIY